MKRLARIFEECAGKYYYCDDRLPCLDARGKGFTTKKQALEAAYMAGFTHAVGSGTYRSGATILGQCPSAAAYQDDHDWALAEEARYAAPAQEGDGR